MDRQRLDGVNSPPYVSLERAAELMRQSEPVIFPTETFFGLGSRALASEASSRIFLVKHRSTLRPLPLILGDWEQLEFIAKVPQSVYPLLKLFWPGPLSVLFEARLRVPEVLTGGTGFVAVRLSSHPVARALAHAVGEPITASSANMSGHSAVRTAEELSPELCASVSGILDLPPMPAGGLPSTLVQVEEGSRLRVLRQGAIGLTELEAAGYEVLSEETGKERG